MLPHFGLKKFTVQGRNHLAGRPDRVVHHQHTVDISRNHTMGVAVYSEENGTKDRSLLYPNGKKFYVKLVCEV